MNWTGGRLSRHSRRADSSTTSKQKQHFAKMRSHLMSGSVKKGPVRRPNFDMAAPQSPDELSVMEGTVKTKLQQQLFPFGHDLQYHGVSGENKHSVQNSRHGQPAYMGSKDVPQSSPHSYETKREPISTIEAVDEEYEVQDDMEAIRRKRFWILREGDWLGLSIQRPLQLRYTESENRDAIGKRRKLNASYEAQYSRVQDKVVSPFASNRHIPCAELFPKPGQNQSQLTRYGDTPGANGSVRIFIDGRERHVRDSSGSVTNQLHPEYDQSSSSSDVMLLDLEGSGSRQRQPHQSNSNMVDGSGCILKLVEHGRQGSEEKSMSSVGDYPSSGPRVHQIKGPSRNMNPPSLELQSTPTLPMGRTNTNWLSAPLVIYHPTPRSSTTSQLLSKPSTFEGSVAATAGIKRTVTASVAKDEEMWRSWLMAESDKEESSVWPVDSQSDEPVPDGLSPSRNTGQSISPRSSFTDRSGSVVCRNDESVHGKRPIRSISTFSSSATGCPDGENSGNHDIIPSLGTVGTSKPRGAANDCIQLPNTPQNWKRKEKNQGFAWKAFVLAEPSENPDVIVQLSKKVAQEDTDLAWKKFVLSSDFNDERTTFSTENEEESKTTASNKRMQRSPSKISLQAHAAKTAIHLEPRLDHSSDTTSARVIYHPSTEFAAPRSLGSEANSRFSKPSMHANGSVHEASQAPRMLSQAAGKPLKWVTDKQGNPGDPLAQYMPQQSQSERDIFMAKKAQLPAPDESFERGLDDSLKQALHLGRRYAKQEKERYVKQNKEIYSKREKERCTKRRSKETRDIYDIPISDDTEEMDDE